MKSDMGSQEMIPAGELSVQQRHAAYLDANGLGRQKMAELLGVTTKTITVWRGKPEYQKVVDYWVNLEMDRLERIFTAVRIEKLEAGRIGLNKLIALTEAKDEDGRPIIATQLAAAQRLVQVLAEATPRADGGGGDGPTAQAAVIVVQREGSDVTVVPAGEIIEHGEVDGGDR